MSSQTPPDDLPRSPTGRVPHWVRDQAAGKSPQAMPFRAPPDQSGRPPKRGRRRLRQTVGLGSVGLLAVLAWLLSSHPQLFAWVSPTPAVASAHAPPPGLGETARPAGRPIGGAIEKPGSGFRFLQHEQDRITPVTWFPCRPIHYVIRPDNSPPGGSAAIHGAISQVAAASGLRFVDDGSTAEAPSGDRPAYEPKLYGNRWAPVLIAWATPNEVPDFGIDVLGEAGPIGVFTPSGGTTYISGILYLDAGKLGAYTKARQQGLVLATVLHELGHLVGLAHVNDKAQMMFPQVSLTLRNYAPGDLAGLAALGEGPCQPSV
ncbi:MAG: matrixin family metalloprotease [Actinomycetes bacterium]